MFAPIVCSYLLANEGLNESSLSWSWYKRHCCTLFAGLFTFIQLTQNNGYVQSGGFSSCQFLSVAHIDHTAKWHLVWSVIQDMLEYNILYGIKTIFL